MAEPRAVRARPEGLAEAVSSSATLRRKFVSFFHLGNLDSRSQQAKPKTGPAPALALSSFAAVAPAVQLMTSQGTAHGRFQRAIHRRNVQAAEMAAREMGGLSLADALVLCELLGNVDPARYERAALRWLQRFIDERLPPLTEVALAATVLAELRHGTRNTGIETLKRSLHRG